MVSDAAPRDRPAGELFSRNYLRQPAGSGDLGRFRKRLGGYSSELVNDRSGELLVRFVETIRRECGVDVPRVGMGWSIPRFFEDAETRDVLDAITHITSVVDPDRSCHCAHSVRGRARKGHLLP